MSSIYLIDYFANTIKSPMHQRTVISKLIFLLLILFSIVISESILILIFVFLTIIALLIAAKLPFLKILKWSVYPAFFASLFALSQIGFGLLPLQTILRAIDAAVLALLIVCTTPYPNLFSLFSKISVILSNVFFLAYRSFFLIIDELQTKIRILKLRGGYAGGPFRTLKNISAVIGQTLIYSAEKSEIIYNLLTVRGYQGIIFSKIKYKFKTLDLILIALGAAILILTIKL